MRTVLRIRFAGMMPALIDRVIVSTETRSNAAVSATVQSSGSIISLCWVYYRRVCYVVFSPRFLGARGGYALGWFMNTTTFDGRT